MHLELMGCQEISLVQDGDRAGGGDGRGGPGEGLFLQEWITLVTDGGNVVVKRTVWRDEGMEYRMLAS